MNITDRIRTSTKFVADNSKHVKVNHDQLKQFAAKLKLGKEESWLENTYNYPQGLSLEEELRLVFMIDTTVFCFWHRPKWLKEVNGKKLGGSFSLVACYGEAVSKDKSILEVGNILSMNIDKYAELMKGDTDNHLRMLDERLKALHETFAALKHKYNGSALNFIEANNEDAEKMLEALLNDSPRFRDIYEYDGKEVYILKLAQLLIEDVNFIYKKHTGKELKNIKNLTVFADYKLPQTLRQHGVLEYSDELAQIIDNQQELPYSSVMEIEIRANLVQAVEDIVTALNGQFSSAEVDAMIFSMSQSASKDIKPHHNTQTWFY